MSEQLVVLGQTDLQKGGLGLNSRIFSDMAPSFIEIVQKTTRQTGAIPGKLRITDVNQHYDEMQVVMLVEPTEQREMFEGKDFTADSKICFSLDNAYPHEKAKVPQAEKCGYYGANGYYVPTCMKASWDKYRQTKNREDMPKCRSFWHLLLADRVTQLPYYFNVKGSSIEPFRKAMKQVVKMIYLMKASALAENEALAKTNPEVAAAVAANEWHPLLKPMPSIYDVSFKIKAVPEGIYYVLGVSDIAPLKQEDRAKFGAIFLQVANRKANYAAQKEEAEQQAAVSEAEASVDTAVVEPPSGPISGEIVI